MVIEWISTSDKSRWDEIIQRFEKADIYYLNDYAASFKLVTEGKPFLVYYSAADFEACNVVQLRPVPNSNSFDLTSVYGYGGWLTQGRADSENIDRLLTFYESSCNDRDIISEVIRTHPNCCNINLFNNWYTQQEIGPIVNLDLTKEDLWADVPSKNRNMIRKAEKLGITINFNDTRISPTEFKAAYDETMARAGASSFYFFPLAFHCQFATALRGCFNYATARLNDDLLCVAMITRYGQIMNYHLSGSTAAARGYPAMNLLIYKAMEWGAASGYKTFNLGGGVGTQVDGLFKFKKSFTRGEPETFLLLTKVFDEARYTKLVEQRERSAKNILKAGFFPKYRAPEDTPGSIKND